MLPKLTPEQDLALFNWDVEVYKVMVKRDQLQTARRETLCNIIRSTHAE